jgi:hypothetical protein
MINYYNNKDFAKEVSIRTGYDISSYDIWYWGKKGLIKPELSGILKDGKRNRPIFTDKEVNDYIVKLETLKVEGKISLQIKK